MSADDAVAALRKRLTSLGALDNTLVIFMGDNGSCTFRGKQFLYEGGIRVPLIVRWPGRIKPGTLREDLISGIDVSAAILAAAGVNLEGHVQLACEAKCAQEEMIPQRFGCGRVI